MKTSGVVGGSVQPLNAAGILAERAVLALNYFNIAVQFEVSTAWGEFEPSINFGAKLPAQFPHPETAVRAWIECTTGAWKTHAAASLELFVQRSGAELRDGHFKLQDVEFSCTADGEMRVKSDSINRTLALLDYAREVHPPQSTGGVNNEKYVSFGIIEYAAYASVKLNNPAIGGDHEGLCCSRGVRLWGDNTVAAFKGGTARPIDTIGVDAGSGLLPVRFEGEETTQRYDPTGVVKIFANVNSKQDWHHLTVDSPTAEFIWHWTTTAPQ